MHFIPARPCDLLFLHIFYSLGNQKESSTGISVWNGISVQRLPSSPPLQLSLSMNATDTTNANTRNVRPLWKLLMFCVSAFTVYGLRCHEQQSLVLFKTSWSGRKDTFHSSLSIRPAAWTSKEQTRRRKRLVLLIQARLYSLVSPFHNPLTQPHHTRPHQASLLVCCSFRLLLYSWCWTSEITHNEGRSPPKL